jgi:hypothetical protein
MVQECIMDNTFEDDDKKAIRIISIMSSKETLISEMPDIQTSMKPKQLQIMAFLMNALEQGWTVKKRDNEYIFSKKHEGKREVFQENYLESFIQSNLDMSILNP